MDRTKICQQNVVSLTLDEEDEDQRIFLRKRKENSFEKILEEFPTI